MSSCSYIPTIVSVDVLFPLRSKLIVKLLPIDTGKSAMSTNRESIIVSFLLRSKDLPSIILVVTPPQLLSIVEFTPFKRSLSPKALKLPQYSEVK